MSWFDLVPGRVVGLVSLVLWHCVRGLFPYFSFSSFLKKRIAFIVIFWFLLVPGSGSGACLPSFLTYVSFLMNGAPNKFFIAHERRGNMVCRCLGSMLV